MKILIIITLSIASLSACSSGGNNDAGIDDPAPAVNQLKQLSLQDANSEPGTLGDASKLRTDINVVFDEDTPIEVGPGDSIQDVINRAEGS